MTFVYNVTPRKGIYFIGWNDPKNLSRKQIWTQGQGKYTSNWLPSFDDVNEKAIFNLSIEFQSDFKVVSNGELQNVNSNGKNKKWSYKMQKPMPSYLVMLAIGKLNLFVQIRLR